jgi:CheY-like chemotaxis protein
MKDPSPMNAAEIHPGSPGREASPAAPRRVLVVDDDDDIRENLVELLAGEGYEVTAAGDGRAALAEAGRSRPDVILLDLMMPVMSGWQFREAQLGDPALAGVPVVVLSAMAADLEVEASLPKPFLVDDLLRLLERLTG